MATAVLSKVGVNFKMTGDTSGTEIPFDRVSEHIGGSLWISLIGDGAPTPETINSPMLFPSTGGQSPSPGLFIKGVKHIQDNQEGTRTEVICLHPDRPHGRRRCDRFLGLPPSAGRRCASNWQAASRPVTRALGMLFGHGANTGRAAKER